MALEDVKHCSRRLTSEKITDRKKAADQLKSLLNNNNIIFKLCQNSQEKKHFTWDHLFSSSKQFLLKEAEKLEKDERNKENPTSSVLSNWANSKRTAAALPKLVLKKSCQVMPHISVNMVIEFVFTILSRERPYLVENFAGDAVQVILNYILTFPQYYLHIPQERWKALIRMSIWIYDNNLRDIHSVSLLGVIEGILKIFKQSNSSSGNISSPSIMLRSLANFLIKSLKNSNSDKQYELKCMLLSLLYTTCSQFGSQWRRLLCKVGEETFESVMSIWENNAKPRQILLFQYLELQLIMHFPQQDGYYHKSNSFSLDAESWKRMLQQLYLVIHDYIHEITHNARITGSGWSKEVVPDEFVALTARLCSLIFVNDDGSSLEVTQVGATQMLTPLFATQRSAKRRRIEFGFIAVCEKLKDGPHEGDIPWFRIFLKMLVQHGEFFMSSGRAYFLLDVLIHLLLQCKKSLFLEEILRCLKGLAQPRYFSAEESNYESSKRKWTQIADITSRLVAGKQCSNIGMDLLQVLISSKLVYSQVSLFRLFLKGIFPLNEKGLHLLETLLIRYPLPKVIKTEDYLCVEETLDPRASLMNLLLPLNDGDHASKQCLEMPVSYPLHCANVLALLRLHSPVKVEMVPLQSRKVIYSRIYEDELNPKELEELYLKTEFSYKQFHSHEYGLDFEKGNLQVLVDVHSMLLDKMKCFVDELGRRRSAAEIQKEDVMLILDTCLTLVHLWPLLDDKRLIDLMPKLDLAWNYIMKLVSPAFETGCIWEGAVVIFHKINKLFEVTLHLYRTKNLSHQYLQGLLDGVSPDILNSIVKIINAREPSPPTNSRMFNSTNFSHSRIQTQSNDSDLDSSFGDSDNEHSSSAFAVDCFDQDMDDDTDQSKINHGQFATLLRSNLSSKDEAILSMNEWLGKMYELSIILNISDEGDKLPFEKCLKPFENMGESEKDEAKTMAFCAVKLLFTMKYDEDNVEDGMKILSILLSKNSNDSRVICCALSTFIDLLQFNGESLIDGHKENLIHLLTKIAEKYVKGMNGLNISRLFFENLALLTKIDPLHTWPSCSVDGVIKIIAPYFFLKNPYHMMRMKTIEAVPLLFQAKGKPLSISDQKKMFEQLYQVAFESLTIEGNLNPDFYSDEGSCRVSSFLNCLISISTSSLVMESYAIYAMVSSVKVNNVDANVIKRALQSITHIQNVTLTTYLESHFSYLLSQWVKDKHPLEEFPFSLLECSDYQTFARRYRDKIIYALFPSEDGLSEIEKISKLLKEDMKILVENNFAPIVATILPPLIAHTLDKAEELKLTRNKIISSTRKFKYIEEVLGCQLLGSHIGHDIGEIVLHLIRLSHDSKQWHKEEVIVTPSWLYFETQTILFTLNHFHNVFLKGQTPLITVLCERGAPIQSVVHGLFSDVATATAPNVRPALASFETFIRFLMQNIDSDLKNMERFLVRRVTHILTNFICQFASGNMAFAEKYCELLHDFVLYCLGKPSSTDALITTLSSVIPRLHSLHSNSSVWGSVYKVMLLFFEADYVPLKEALSALAPFPTNRNNAMLDHVHSLQQKLIAKYQGDVFLRKRVITFIGIPVSDISSYDIENILLLLTEKKTEICELYLAMLPDGCNVAHSLIYKLVCLVSSSDDDQKRRLSLDCLGKLGPVDLNASAFAISHPANERFETLDKEKYMFAEILIALNRHSFSIYHPIVNAAIVALRRTLSLKEYYVAVNELKDESLISDLIPFLPTRKPKVTERLSGDYSLAEFERRVGSKSMYEVGYDLNAWLRTFTVTLIEAGCGSDFFCHLTPVCQVDNDFCRLVLPYILHHSLKTDIEHRRPVVSRMVTKLIEYLSDKLTFREQNQTDVGESHVMKSCLRIIISAINYLRTKDPGICSNDSPPTKWDRNLWLDVNFLVLAKAAFLCGSYFSAVLFAEIACDILLKDTKLSLQDRQLPPLQRIATTTEGKKISALLLQAYNALGASDGVEGCSGGSSITDCVTQSTLNLHRGHNIEAICISDAGNSNTCLLSGLQTTGLYNILFRMTDSSKEDISLASEAQAECAWRLGQWDSLEASKVGNDFNQSFFKSLVSLKDKDETSIYEAHEAFYQSTFSLLRESGNESTSNMYPILSHLQIFSEFSDISKCLKLKTEDEILINLSSVDSLWDEKENFGKLRKVEKEQILSARISTLKILNLIHKDNRRPIQDLLFKCLMKKCELGNLSERFSALHEAKNIKMKSEQLWVLKLEESKLALSLGNIPQTICALEDLIQEIEEHESPSETRLKEYCRTLVFYGQVLRKSKTRPPRLIIEDVYERAIKLIEDQSSCEFLEECYYDLASFGDHLLKEVITSLSSDDSQIRRKQMERSQQELKKAELFKQLKRKENAGEAELKAAIKKCALLERDIKSEKEDFESRKREAEDFLFLCLENYLKILYSSSSYDLSIFRVVSLWFENLTNLKINELVAKYILKIKSHKFIRLLHQLVARLTLIQDSTKHCSKFPAILSHILEYVCCGHPHHGLPMLLMIANAHVDEEILDEMTKSKCKSKGKVRGHLDEVEEEDRVKAAKNLVEKLKSNTKLSSHLVELDMVSRIYITLATKKIYDTKTQPAHYLEKLRNLKFTAPFSLPILVQPSGSYSPPLILKYDPQTSTPGGVNEPLKLTLFSSDGIVTNELLKGNDDLRQDAVLQQVFNVINELLKKDSEASKQSLSVRTYLVCPLSQNTGIIQWCKNTVIFGNYIRDNNRRFYPQNKDLQKCRDLLQRAAKDNTTPDKRTRLINLFEKILSGLLPVFRFFFYEEYPEPERWFNHRCRYARSVATSSIAGYILGIGDRHVGNMLLDTQTAEIVHIDFGIAFDNGKLLPTPERVPFRLTQNIVDGLGVMGVEGPLRKNMETTLRVLREAKSVLITLVEVLRHDPLHQWTLSPSQIAKIQQQELQGLSLSEDGSGVSMAERALLRMQQKLSGLKDAHVLSVPEQVSFLLQQATDVTNFAQMFCGWQAFM